MNLKITLKPLEPYFFGGERNLAFTGGQNSGLAEQNPYFIRSNQLPSQTTLFGLLRYLGIENPDSDYHIDSKVIGSHSYNLFGDRSYGMIDGISPLLLQDNTGDLFLPVPKNRKAAQWTSDGIASFVPFTQYSPVETMDGNRLLPVDDYNEKEAYDNAELINLRDGSLRKNIFVSQIRTGINLNIRHKNNEVSGFFKKEYYTLSKEYSFTFFASVQPGFPVQADRVVFVGQGKTPMAVRLEQCDAPNWEYPAICFSGALTAIAQSDLYYPGTIAELRSRCALVMAELKDHRQFSTVSGASSTAARHKKSAECLHLIAAGSVFLFNDPSQMDAFRAHMNKISETATIAGFNHIQYGQYCSKEK